MYEVWTDGSCRPKKISNRRWEKTGHSSIAIIIKNKSETIFEHYSYIGNKYDNNQAEYEAFIYAVDKIIELDIKSVTFFTDSNMIEKQMRDQYGAYSEAIVPYYMKAKQLIQMIPEHRIKLIDRKFNKEADDLTKKALDQYFAENNINCNLKL